MKTENTPTPTGSPIANPCPPTLQVCAAVDLYSAGRPAGRAFAGVPVHAAARAPFKMPGSLLSIAADAKTIKGAAAGVLTGILYLAPGTLAGVGNLCPHASKGCAAACLFTAGRAGIFETVNIARIMRTRFLHADRAAFLDVLRGEIRALMRRAARLGLRPAVRLNGTSDLPWETLAPSLFTEFPQIRFYDYSKSARRALAFAKGEFPPNYHLTFSLSESNGPTAALVAAAGCNVAAVVDGHRAGQVLEIAGQSFATFDADRHDVRFMDRPAKDGRGRVGVLKAKGLARKDVSGFVVRLEGSGRA
jgi:hypothetical protein